MKLVWHIVRKDFRRHWLGYLLWLGLLAAKVALCAKALTIASADAEWFDRLQLYYGLTTVIAAVTGFLLAASFALDDELVGTRMFWATRPISGLRLLAAKSIGLALFFVAVPVLVWVPWWLYCGSGAWELYQSVAILGFTHGLPVLLALLVSALTGKSSRFLLLLLSAVLLFMLTSLFGAARIFIAPSVPTDVALARDIMAMLFWAGSVFGAIWFQYRTRRAAWSTAIVVTGIGLGIWALEVWPWAFTQAWRGENRSDASVEAVEVRWISLHWPTTTSNRAVAPGFARLQATFQVRGISEKLRLRGGRARLTLTWPDGTRNVQEVGLMSAEPDWVARSLLDIGPDIQLTDPETNAFREQRIAEAKAKREKGELPPSSDAGSFVVLTGDLIVPFSQAERLDRERPVCHADVRLDFRRTIVQLEIPLAVGAEAAGRGARVRVVADLYERRLKPVTPNVYGSYAVVHYDAVRETWLNIAFLRQCGAMSVQSGGRSVRRTLIPMLTPFARETLVLKRPLLRRGDEWEPAPCSEETPRLAVASYEGLVHAQRQCTLTSEQPSR